MSTGIPAAEAKIVVKITNEDKLKGLTAELKKQEDQIRSLNKQYAGTKFFQQAAPAATQIRTLTTDIEKLTKATKQMDPGRMGLGLMAMGNLADDLQYGFKSIVNNIPQVVYMMGGSGGLAGGVAIAAVAVNQLIEHFGQLKDMMQSAWLNVPADHLEKIRIRAEKATEAFDKMSKMPSKVQAKQIDILSDAFLGGDKTGFDAVVKGVGEVVRMDPLHRAQLTDDEKEEIASHERIKKGHQEVLNAPGMPEWERNNMRLLIEDVDRKIRAVQARTEARNDERAKQIAGGALAPGREGDTARATLASMIQNHPGNFPPALAGAIKRAAPEEVERLAEEEKQSETLKAIQHVLERDERRGRSGAERARGGGQAATADQVKQIVDEAGLGRKFSPEGLKDLIKEIVRSGLNQGQAREAIAGLPWLMGQDKTMAERLAQGPLGRGVAMGRFPEPAAEGPMGEKGILGLIGGNRMLRHHDARTKEEMAKQMAGMDEAQARGVLGAMTPQAVLKRAREMFEEKNKQNIERGLGPLQNKGFEGMAERDLLDKQIAAAKARGPGKGEDPLAKAIEGQLKGAGEAGDPKAIAKQMREQFGQQVKKTMLEQNVNRPTAQFLAAQQNAFQAFPQLNQPSQWVGLTQLAKMSATSALNLPQQLPDLARQQLKELVDIRKALADMAAKAKAPPVPGQLP